MIWSFVVRYSYHFVDFHRLKSPYGTINRVAAFRYYVIKGIHFLEHAFLITSVYLFHTHRLTGGVLCWLHIQPFNNSNRWIRLIDLPSHFESIEAGVFVHIVWYVFCVFFRLKHFTWNFSRSIFKWAGCMVFRCVHRSQSIFDADLIWMNATQWKWKKVAQWFFFSVTQQKNVFRTQQHSAGSLHLGSHFSHSLSLLPKDKSRELLVFILVSIQSFIAIRIQTAF